MKQLLLIAIAAIAFTSCKKKKYCYTCEYKVADSTVQRPYHYEDHCDKDENWVTQFKDSKPTKIVNDTLYKFSSCVLVP